MNTEPVIKGLGYTNEIMSKKTGANSPIHKMIQGANVTEIDFGNIKMTHQPRTRENSHE